MRRSNLEPTQQKLHNHRGESGAHDIREAGRNIQLELETIVDLEATLKVRYTQRTRVENLSPQKRNPTYLDHLFRRRSLTRLREFDTGGLRVLPRIVSSIPFMAPCL